MKCKPEKYILNCLRLFSPFYVYMGGFPLSEENIISFQCCEFIIRTLLQQGIHFFNWTDGKSQSI
jgi:hypothetical protein